MKKVIKASQYRGVVYDEDEKEQAYRRYANSVLNKLRAIIDTIDDAPEGFADTYDLNMLYEECLDSAQSIDWALNGDK